MNKQKRFDNFYMSIARQAACFSYCTRKKVGALWVKNDVMVIGYNGTVSGFENNCEDENGDTLPEVLHAESNVFAKIMNSTLVSSEGTLYCTLSPCINCAKLIIQGKISRFVYETDHSDQSGILLMIKAGVIVEKIKSE